MCFQNAQQKKQLNKQRVQCVAQTRLHKVRNASCGSILSTLLQPGLKIHLHLPSVGSEMLESCAYSGDGHCLRGPTQLPPCSHAPCQSLCDAEQHVSCLLCWIVYCMHHLPCGVSYRATRQPACTAAPGPQRAARVRVHTMATGPAHHGLRPLTDQLSVDQLNRILYHHERREHHRR